MEEINQHIKHLRKDYAQATLSESDVNTNPFKQFEKWFDEAINAQLDEPNAMTISTVSASGRPSSRIVLLCNFDERGFVFFTNYKSRKAMEAKEDSAVALNFFWQSIERQVRIEGKIEKVSAQESDDYFASRPRESQIGAWASAQSETLNSRKELENQVKFFTDKFKDTTIPRPSHWGGLRIVPDFFEFWQGRSNRLHDRIFYSLQNEEWKIGRLNP